MRHVGRAHYREFLSGIFPSLREDPKFPYWPPDCFALCLALLKRTGAYSTVLRDWSPDAGWNSEVVNLGAKWRPNCESFDGMNNEWRRLCESFSRPIDDLCGDRVLSEMLIRLAAVADEACSGIGAPGDDKSADADFLATGAIILKSCGTLGYEIDGERLRVLPRSHTPQNGLTDRSLSLYLSLCDPGEVIPKWSSTPFNKGDSINLLAIPWPFEVVVSQFRDVTASASARLPEGFGFFAYDPMPEAEVVGVVTSLYQEAKRKLGRIDGVVLPELAITTDEFSMLREALPSECFLVSGVGSPPTAGQRGRNEVRLSFPQLSDVIQKKHHPWKLNQSQIIQYGLGGVLDPFREWWEYADFTDRHLNFIAMSEDLVLSVLICEDLARPDPVAALVRAVGPNLVIALLMDGPQTKERWGARYATVLADDPGCSVLALTSLGAAQLSRPQTGLSRSRVVALWKDALNGATEIELPQDCEAVAISLSTQYKTEYAADGRSDQAAAAFPILSGVHPISVRGKLKA